MSNIRCINFYDLCRICTASSEQKTNIFSTEGKTRQLTMKIAECLALFIEEKDRLPKVICEQCVKHVENMYEFRNICKNSQSMLNSCLNTATMQSREKVYIKDAVSGSGKSLSVLSIKPSGGSQLPALIPTSVGGAITLQTPTTVTNSTTISSSQNTIHQSDLLNSIMQVVGGLKQPQLLCSSPPYTITLDSKFDSNQQQPTEYNIEAVPTIATVLAPKQQDVIKREKHTVIEEFIKLKPDIKITPLGKRDTSKLSHNQSLLQSLQQAQVPANDQQQQSQQLIQQQQQQTTLQLHQLQQLQQQLQQQWQQQQLQQQLQQLTTQLQAQPQITFSSPTSLGATLTPSHQEIQQQQQLQCTSHSNTSSLQPLSPKNKKSKLNFVLSSPTSQPFTSNVSSLANTATAATQPQIQLQLQPSSVQQHSQQINTANLLSNLAPHPTTANILSPNKCFLPITIRDEHSEQIVAHIDAKNLVLPTTYQVQMKLQPQLATADGHPIIQLTSTSIPAMLQLTPQSVTDSTFQSVTSDSVFTAPSRQPQQLAQQQHVTNPHHQSVLIEQQRQQLQPTAQVTSQQVITPPRCLISSNISQKNKSISSAIKDNTVFKTPQRQITQEKYKIPPSSCANIIEITPTTNFTQQIMEQVKQQQLQKQHAKQPETTTTTTSMFTQHTGITVQRVQPKTLTSVSQPTLTTCAMTTTTKASDGEEKLKLPVLKKNNITISRITTQSLEPNLLQHKPYQQKQLVHKQSVPLPLTSQLHSKMSSHLQPQQQQNHERTQRQQQQKQIQTQDFGAISSSQQFKTQTPTSPATIKKVSHRSSSKLVPMVTIPAQNVTHIAPVVSNTTILRATGTSINQQNTSSIIDNTRDGTTPIGASNISSISFSCETCGRGFKKKEHLTQHTKLHAGLRPFKCTEDSCNKAFSRKEHLLRHLVSHTGKKMFSCDVCQKPFSRKDNLNKHRRVHNTHAPENLYKCELCDKTFEIKMYFEKHKEIHKKPDAIGTSEKSEKKNTEQGKSTIAPMQQTLQNQHQEKQDKQLTPQMEILSPQPQRHQQQQQQQIMQVQLQPHVVTTQDLVGNTITITQAPDQTLSTSIANFMHLNLAQFQNDVPTPSQLVCKLEK